MKKRLLLVIILCATVFMFSGCSNGKRMIKLNKISFNEPVDFIEMKKSTGSKSSSSGNNWITYRYGFKGYTLRLVYREKETYEDYSKTAGLKFKDTRVHGRKAHYYENDEYRFTVFDYKGDLYIIEFSGDKNKVSAYKDLLKSIR